MNGQSFLLDAIFNDSMSNTSEVMDLAVACAGRCAVKLCLAAKLRMTLVKLTPLVR